MKKFWLVWNGGQTPYDRPTVRHETKEAANQEAQRLCDKYGGEFFVLESVTRTRRINVKTEDLTDDSSIAATDSDSPENWAKEDIRDERY